MIKQLGGDITNSQEMVRWGVLGVESKIINTNSSHSLVKCDEYGIDQPTITNDSEMNDDVKIMMTTDEHCDANLTPLDQGLLLLTDIESTPTDSSQGSRDHVTASFEHDETCRL